VSGRAAQEPAVERLPSWQRRSAKRFGGESLERSKAFVDAARDLVAEGGLEAVTLRPLLERSGLSRRAFYDRFDGMDDVLVALYEETVEAGANHLRKRISDIKDPVSRLERLIRSMATMSRNPASRTFMLAMTSERSRLCELRPHELEEAGEPIIELMAEILERGMDQGTVRPTNVQRLAATLNSVVASEIHRNLNLRGRDKGWIDDLCDFCLNAVRHPDR
jgi:AcrR family transcriptional regulator